MARSRQSHSAVSPIAGSIQAMFRTWAEPVGVKGDPTTRETTVAGVYVAGDAGNAVQSALRAAAPGANAPFFVNHSLVADEIAAAVGAAA